jgi:Transglutaminase-like superfamily
MAATLSRLAHSRLAARPKTRIVVPIVLTISFMTGFGVALLLRPRATIQAASIVPPTDFDIVLPEGSTTITVTDPRLQDAQLARFKVERHGNSVEGLPQAENRIPPRKTLSVEDSAFFRRELAQLITPSDSPWERANKIRNWLTNTQHRTALPGLATRVPREAYVQMRQGQPVLCGNLAEIYVALCESIGLIARTVGLSLMVRDGTFGSDTHAGAEVWIPSMGGWIYEDSTFNCYWKIEGEPASAIRLHDALMEGREIELVSPDPKAELAVKSYYVDPRLFFRHISYEYKPGGPLLYYVDGRLEPLNLHDRNWIQTTDRTVVESLDTNGNTVVEHRGEIVPGIFAQLIGNVLFIRDRRPENRGIRVRSSNSPVEVCAYEHWRAEELGLFQGKNLVSNGSFNLSGTEAVARNWSVSGPVEALTTMGGQGMAALAGGKLSQRIEVTSGHRYLMYARISVTRGLVTWSLADAERGMDSKGVLRPSLMSEVISDVVESRSGYLDVSFELPEGGGFRVMDVIVTEMPTNVFDNMQRIAQVRSGSRQSK